MQPHPRVWATVIVALFCLGIGMTTLLGADALDDTDLGLPDLPDQPEQSASPGAPPSPQPPASTPAPAQNRRGLTAIPVDGAGAPGAGTPDLARAWNTVTALACVCKAMHGEDSHATLRNWQAVRVREDVESALSGLSDPEAPLARLVRLRLSRLIAGAPPPPDPDGLSADSETEDEAYALAYYDRSDAPPAREAARRLADRAGDVTLAATIQSMALRRSALTPTMDRTRTRERARRCPVDPRPSCIF